MNLQDLLSNLVGTPSGDSAQRSKGAGGLGGLAGGAAAGSLLGLLMGKKSTRKFAGKAVKFGGMAVLGGLAYRAFQNWQENQSPQGAPRATVDDVTRPAASFLPPPDPPATPLELTLVKAMIAAAKADGHIDADEQKRIFDSVEKMNLPPEQKSLVFDCLREGVSVDELAAGVDSVEHKADVYLAACLAIDPDDVREREWLDKLASALDLPDGLPAHLEHQAAEGLADVT